MDVKEYQPFATTATKSNLIFIMQNRHRGQANAAKGNQIISELWGEDAAKDKSYNNPHHRSLRAMIEDAIHNDHALICSDSVRGYWWADSLQDGMKAAEANRDRANTQKKNAEALIGNLMQQYGRLF